MGRACSRRNQSSSSSGRRGRAGAGLAPVPWWWPAWWSTSASSSVEDAGNFDSSSLPSRRALATPGLVVCASVRGTGRRLAPRRRRRRHRRELSTAQVPLPRRMKLYGGRFCVRELAGARSMPALLWPGRASAGGIQPGISIACAGVRVDLLTSKSEQSLHTQTTRPNGRRTAMATAKRRRECPSGGGTKPAAT